MRCTEVLRTELSCSPSRFGCAHSNTQLFGVSQWRCCSDLLFLLLHRLPWAVFFTVIHVCHVWHSTSTYGASVPMFYLYYSYWGELLTMLDTLLGLVVAIIIQHGYLKTWHLLLSVYWILHNVSAWTTLIVVLSYWALHYPGTQPSFFNIVGHVMIGVYIILDTMVSAIPMRLQHGYQGTIVALVYVIFNYCYFLSGGRNPFQDSQATTYPYLDWDVDPGMAFLKGLAVVAVGVILWIFLYGVYVIRMFIFSRYHKDIDPEWTEIP